MASEILLHMRESGLEGINFIHYVTLTPIVHGPEIMY